MTNEQFCFACFVLVDTFRAALAAGVAVCDFYLFIVLAVLCACIIAGGYKK